MAWEKEEKEAGSNAKERMRHYDSQAAITFY